jgi:preprotein translocase subunit SecD
MALQLTKIFQSKLTWWMIANLIGAYFLFTIDLNQLNSPHKKVIEKIMSAIKIPKINLGIDLQGGTHLVIEVEIEKAIGRRLFIEMKTVEKMLKKAKCAVPSKKEVTDTMITYHFNDAQEARHATEVLKENSVIKATSDVSAVKITLNSAEENRIRMTSTEQAITVLRNRLDSFDVRGLIVQQHGERKIVIQLPGLDDSEDIKSTIARNANLEFKIVEEAAHSEEKLLDAYDGYLPNDLMIVPLAKENGEVREYYAVSTFPDVTGEHIADAFVSYDEYQRPVISFKFDSVGARDFRELTVIT